MEEFNFIYYIFCGLAMLSSLMVILANNPVHSVFYLILVFVITSCIILMFNVEFIGMIFIIVYVGAIAVLFLFVVMMLNVRIVEKISSLVKYIPLGLMMGILLFYELFSNMEVYNVNFYNYFEWTSFLDTKSTIFFIGEILYNYFILEFLLGGFILLVAMIGTIVLTLNHRINLRRQEVYRQVGRSLSLSMYK
jgi:NADH-quinone oxidoreductase subunit J